MRPDPREEDKRWLQQARQDIDDARYNQAGGRYHLTRFLAQQAAEKALKGYLYAQGVERVWGHSVADLARQAAEHDARFEVLIGVGGGSIVTTSPPAIQMGYPVGFRRKPSMPTMQKRRFARHIALSGRLRRY